jgi:hypothetical protein
MTAINIWVPYLPPSSNKIYIRHPTGKGKILSPDARKFKIDAMRTIQQSGRVGFINFNKNVPYELKLAIFLDTIENKDSKVGERYKQIDLSNRVKLIEDTVAEATGIDDRHNFRMTLEKHCDPENRGIYVSFGPIAEDRVGLTKEQYEIQRDQHDRTGPSLQKGRTPNRTPRPWKGYANRVAERASSK